MVSIGVKTCVLHSLIDKKSICENWLSSMVIGEFDRGLDKSIGVSIKVPVTTVKIKSFYLSLKMVSMGVEKCVLHSLIDKKSICKIDFPRWSSVNLIEDSIKSIGVSIKVSSDHCKN